MDRRRVSRLRESGLGRHCALTMTLIPAATPMPAITVPAWLNFPVYSLQFAHGATTDAYGGKGAWLWMLCLERGGGGGDQGVHGVLRCGV